MEKVEPEWVDITTIGSSWEEQIDTRAHPGESVDVRYRHRDRAYTGQCETPWLPGPAPR
jgi:hypothetical protein